MTTTSKVRRVESAEFWQAHIEAWQHSGQTLQAYAQSQGLSRSTFSRWRRRLSDPSPLHSSASAPPLARVEVVTAAAPAAPCRVSLPNGLSVDWPTDAPAERLAAILAAAAQCQ